MRAIIVQETQWDRLPYKIAKNIVGMKDIKFVSRVTGQVVNEDTIICLINAEIRKIMETE